MIKIFYICAICGKILKASEAWMPPYEPNVVYCIKHAGQMNKAMNKKTKKRNKYITA